jgi:D-alanine--D-alanine ligase
MRKRSELDRFAPTDRLNEAQGFFLVGVGGAGMSGVGRMLLHRGHDVRGTDSTDSDLIRALRHEGIDINVGHTGEFIREGDAVILTDAIDLDRSPEVWRAQELGCPIFRRSQALAWLLRGKKTIAVTGTHGKTTTTGMIAAGLRAGGLDPTIVVGAEVPEFGSSVIEGTGDWAVIEACEAYESYRDFEPFIAVLTNLELDHIDYHENWENLLASMRAFLAKVPENGAFVVADDPGAQEAAAGQDRSQKTYTGSTFHDKSGIAEIAIPGAHSLMNAGGALEACLLAGADPVKAAAGIAAFRGAERRLQVMFDSPSVTVIDDYAHHPTEIRASLTALKSRYHGRRIVVVYQPHLYSRTAPLINEFAETLDEADFIVLTDIYPAREEPMAGVSSLRIVEALKKPNRYIPSRHLLPRVVKGLIQKGDVIVGMGAGNISEFAPGLIKELHRPESPRVVVLRGGESPEREVSLHSGQAVYDALRRKGYDAFMLDVTDVLLSKGAIPQLTGEDRPDCALIEVHGTGAEDGAIQGLLELIHLPYSGCDIQSSALAMDKNLTKILLKEAGIDVPRGVLVTGDETGELPDGPLVVKPNAQGSTVGLSFVRDRKDLCHALEVGFRYGDEVLIEELVEGVEISVPVMGDQALPVVEIVPVSGSYDFASKYIPGATEEICPARLTDEQTKRAQDIALKAHKALRCSGVTRTDMIVQKDRIVALEVNTVPGMTPTSLVPRSALAAGISFDDLVEWMVKDALKTTQA